MRLMTNFNQCQSSVRTLLYPHRHSINTVSRRLIYYNVGLMSSLDVGTLFD